jgi:hypothetical protein
MLNLAASRASARARSYPVFIDPTLASPFARKRALYFLAILLPVLALCAHFGQGLLGFLALGPAFWALPLRCCVEATGVRVSWLFVSEHVSWDELRAVELGEHGRCGAGKRGSVLTLERRDSPPMILRGREAVLSELAGEIARCVQRDAKTGEG